MLRLEPLGFPNIIDRKLAQIEKREEDYNRKEKGVADQQKRLEDLQAEVQKVIEDQRKRLEQISGLTAVDAMLVVDRGAQISSQGFLDAKTALKSFVADRTGT